MIRIRFSAFLAQGVGGFAACAACTCVRAFVRVSLASLSCRAAAVVIELSTMYLATASALCERVSVLPSVWGKHALRAVLCACSARD